MCMQTFKEPFTDTYSMDTLDIIDYIEPSKLKKRQKDKALLELIWQSWREFLLTFKSKLSKPTF